MCIRDRVKSAPAKAPTHHWEPPEKNFDRVHIDCAGPFLDHQFLILVDAKSKWLEVRILKTLPTSKSTIEHLMDIFTTHGFPRVLVSDNASIFTSPEFTDFCHLHGIFPKYIAPGHPATNGQMNVLCKLLNTSSKQCPQAPLLRLQIRYGKYFSITMQHHLPMAKVLLNYICNGRYISASMPFSHGLQN